MERRATQFKGYKTMADAAVTYSSETWTVEESRGKEEQKKLNLLEMWRHTHQRIKLKTRRFINELNIFNLNNIPLTNRRN
jgi:hypothetical protein